jgi:hypothetical protein
MFTVYCDGELIADDVVHLRDALHDAYQATLDAPAPDAVASVFNGDDLICTITT